MPAVLIGPITRLLASTDHEDEEEDFYVDGQNNYLMLPNDKAGLNITK